MVELDLIQPNWPAPNTVKALSTTRRAGVSVAPYDSLNLGAHVGDRQDHVLQNRQRLGRYLPQSPMWLNQVHGTTVALGSDYTGECDADASTTKQGNQVCLVMTADCLPVLFCDEHGTQVAAAHAGWRGLLDGVLEKTVAQFSSANDVMAWLGPAIGPDAFEVGQEVKDQFCKRDDNAQVCFKPSDNVGKWLADIYALARIRLANVGVVAVYGGDFCTYSQAQQFFSYRRDGVTGRMASCIWIAN